MQKQSTLESRKRTSVFKCDKCDYSCESAPDLKKNQDSHKVVSGHFKCDDCGREFNEEWKKNAHVKIHTKFDCNQCGKTFKYSETMRKHERIVHEKAILYCHYFNNQLPCPFDTECIFLHEDADNCKYGILCERMLCMFKHAHNVKEMHANECVTVVDDMETIIVNVNEEETIEVDANVEDILTVNYNNEEIIVDIHEENIVVINTSDELLVKDIDSLATASLQHVNVNIDIFKCSICDFASARKSDLKDHKTTIHNWCFICFSSYTNQEYLKKHFKRAHSKKMNSS